MTDNQKNKLFINHIESYKESLLVRNVLDGNSTFEKEVNNFYGLATWYEFELLGNPANGDKFEFSKEEDISKKGKIPETLIEVLNSFDEKNLNPNLLKYDSVRKGYLKCKKRSNILGLSGLAISLGLITSPIYLSESFFHENLGLIFPIPMVVGAGLMAFSLHGAFMGGNKHFDEYLNLHNRSLKADNLMKKFYGKKNSQ